MAIDSKELDKEFKSYLAKFTSDAELGKLMSKVSFQELFNPEFLKANSKFATMDEICDRSGFGIVNLMEVENVNQENWNKYIAANCDCETWHDFGKLAMIDWMKKAIEFNKQKKN